MIGLRTFSVAGLAAAFDLAGAAGGSSLAVRAATLSLSCWI
jgi:hypothetical protein